MIVRNMRMFGRNKGITQHILRITTVNTMCCMISVNIRGRKG